MSDPDICCPEFSPELWDQKEFSWEGKKFVKSRLWTFFYIPIGFGKTMTKLIESFDKAGATVVDNVCLSDHTSSFNMDVYLATDKEIPDAENVTISGKFISKVYEGPYQDTGIWTEDFKVYASSKNYEVKKWYMWYVYCPKCAEKYGHNYTVIVGQVG